MGDETTTLDTPNAVTFTLDAAKMAAAIDRARGIPPVQGTLGLEASDASAACADGNHGGCMADSCACACHTTGMADEPTEAEQTAQTAADAPCACEGTCNCNQTVAAPVSCTCSAFTSINDAGQCGTCNQIVPIERVDALAALGLLDSIPPQAVDILTQIEHATANLAPDTPSAPIDPANPGRFRAILLTEEEPTPDGRIIAAGATTWRPLPLTLMYQPENLPGHTGAVPVGIIESITRVAQGNGKGDQIVGEGPWDNSEQALECARLVKDGVVTGISIDGGNVVREMEASDDDTSLERYTKVTLLAATVLPIQAVTSAKIDYLAASSDSVAWNTIATVTFGADGTPVPSIEYVMASAEGVGTAPLADHAIVASAPIVYPAHYFANPEFSGPTPVRTLPPDEQGRVRVLGHLAPWDACHTGYQGRCVTPPRGQGTYGYFRTGQLPLEEGGWQAVGRITMDTNHAAKTGITPTDAMSHYDHTGLLAAFVDCGEDEYGIWVSGVLAPDLSAERATAFTGASLSGDWRRIGGRMELIGALCVNTPGFAVRVVQDDVPVALVAAGYGPETRERIHLSTEFDRLDREHREEATALRADVAALSARVTRLAALVDGPAREFARARLEALLAADTGATDRALADADQVRADVLAVIDGTPTDEVLAASTE